MAAAQLPLEATLTEEEARRNSRRLDLLYLASSHPVAPDVFQLCDAAGAADEAARATLERPLDPQLSGARPLAFCASTVSCQKISSYSVRAFGCGYGGMHWRVRPTALCACAPSGKVYAIVQTPIDAK